MHLVGYERHHMSCWNGINSHCWALSTTINRFESCFESKTSNNSSKKNAKWFCCMTMLDMLQM